MCIGRDGCFWDAHPPHSVHPLALHTLPRSELLGKDVGHTNQRQKIQYHLRLKQELEEMRLECTVLLRERFHLEQCIRCLWRGY